LFALGWVGLGAGVLRRVLRGRFELVALVAYAWASSLAYGFLITLWFWPFLGRGGPTFYSPGLGPHAQLARYWRFYVLTSLPWDTGRALFSNVPVVAVLARPVTRLLDRIAERFQTIELPAQNSVRYTSAAAPLGGYTAAVSQPDANGLTSIQSES
jgi:energy-coupling factor transport system substrate-specific component